MKNISGNSSTLSNIKSDPSRFDASEKPLSNLKGFKRDDYKEKAATRRPAPKKTRTKDPKCASYDLIEVSYYIGSGKTIPRVLKSGTDKAALDKECAKLRKREGASSSEVAIAYEVRGSIKPLSVSGL